MNIKNKIDVLSNSIKVKSYVKSLIITLSIIIFLIGTFFIPVSLPQEIGQNFKQLKMIDDGKILLAPTRSRNTYLLDNNGTVNHTWPSEYKPGLAAYWLGNGTILRTIQVGIMPVAGGAGGGVQKVELDGTITWDFRYDTNKYLSHHDVKSLPNENILLIAWEEKTRTEVIVAGRNPNYVSSQGLMPDHIIEVQPTGPTSGSTVWEWHVWDHLIQDYDSSKANYGVVENHPELVDINYVTSTEQDWMHTNSIDYNQGLDQILISVHNFGEVWVIDHSTTTEEAAGHTGGNSGKGGDLLYRWGNPAAYRRGTTSDRKLFSQHDASWIKPGYPGQENILIFNNGVNRPNIEYSSVDEIIPPVNIYGEYYLSPNSSYGPINQTWTYIANPPSSFFASHLSGAQRLANGNTLICNGETGEIFEVNPNGAIVWQYNTKVEVFKVVYLYPEELGPSIPDLECTGSLSWNKIKPGATANGSFQVQNIGDLNSSLNWTINVSSIIWGKWLFSPESGKNLTPSDGQVTVHVSVVAPNEKNSKFEGYIIVENQDDPSDFDLIPVYLKTPVNINIIQLKFYQFMYKIKDFFSEKIHYKI